MRKASTLFAKEHKLKHAKLFKAQQNRDAKKIAEREKGRTHMRLFLIAVTMMGLFSVVGIATAASIADKLNGEWISQVMSVRIDLPTQTYDAIALGQSKKSVVKVVSEQGDTIRLDVNGKIFIAKIVNDNALIMSKEGGIPVHMTRK